MGPERTLPLELPLSQFDKSRQWDRRSVPSMAPDGESGGVWLRGLRSNSSAPQPLDEASTVGQVAADPIA